MNAMDGDEDLWSRSGLRQFQRVSSVVTGHRGRFGVDVEIVGPRSGIPAFIDFVMLADSEHVEPKDYPPIGSRVEAITLDFMPNGELRLSARPSDLAPDES